MLRPTYGPDLLPIDYSLQGSFGRQSKQGILNIRQKVLPFLSCNFTHTTPVRIGSFHVRGTVFYADHPLSRVRILQNGPTRSRPDRIA